MGLHAGGDNCFEGIMQKLQDNPFLRVGFDVIKSSNDNNLGTPILSISRPRQSMTTKLLSKIISISCAALLVCASTGCRQRVILAPTDDDLVVLNGCVISACNYLEIVKAKHALEKNFWAKILLVRFANHPAGHAYCVWETEGNIYGYDRNSGGFPLPVYTKDARSIAIVLAQELSKYVNEPLSVSQAEFVDPNEAELYSFNTLQLKEDPAPNAVLGTSLP